MKILDKETVLKWIEIDILYRESKYQTPFASYYDYLKDKCLILQYDKKDLDNILDDLYSSNIIEKYTENNLTYFTLNNRICGQ